MMAQPLPTTPTVDGRLCFKPSSSTVIEGNGTQDRTLLCVQHHHIRHTHMQTERSAKCARRWRVCFPCCRRCRGFISPAVERHPRGTRTRTSLTAAAAAAGD